MGHIPDLTIEQELCAHTVGNSESGLTPAQSPTMYVAKFGPPIFQHCTKGQVPVCQSVFQEGSCFDGSQLPELIDTPQSPQKALEPAVQKYSCLDAHHAASSDFRLDPSGTGAQPVEIPSRKQLGVDSFMVLFKDRVEWLCKGRVGWLLSLLVQARTQMMLAEAFRVWAYASQSLLLRVATQELQRLSKPGRQTATPATPASEQQVMGAILTTREELATEDVVDETSSLERCRRDLLERARRFESLCYMNASTVQVLICLRIWCAQALDRPKTTEAMNPDTGGSDGYPPSNAGYDGKFTQSAQLVEPKTHSTPSNRRIDDPEGHIIRGLTRQRLAKDQALLRSVLSLWGDHIMFEYGRCHAFKQQFTSQKEIFVSSPRNEFQDFCFRTLSSPACARLAEQFAVKLQKLSETFEKDHWAQVSFNAWKSTRQLAKLERRRAHHLQNIGQDLATSQGDAIVRALFGRWKEEWQCVTQQHEKDRWKKQRIAAACAALAKGQSCEDEVIIRMIFTWWKEDCSKTQTLEQISDLKRLIHMEHQGTKEKWEAVVATLEEKWQQKYEGAVAKAWSLEQISVRMLLDSQCESSLGVVFGFWKAFHYELLQERLRTVAEKWQQTFESSQFRAKNAARISALHMAGSNDEMILHTFLRIWKEDWLTYQKDKVKQEWQEAYHAMEQKAKSSVCAAVFKLLGENDELLLRAVFKSWHDDWRREKEYRLQQALQEFRNEETRIEEHAKRTLGQVQAQRGRTLEEVRAQSRMVMDRIVAASDSSNFTAATLFNVWKYDWQLSKFQQEAIVWRQKIEQMNSKAISRAHSAAVRLIASNDEALMRIILDWWREIRAEFKKVRDEEQQKKKPAEGYAEARRRSAELGLHLVDKLTRSATGCDDKQGLLQQAVFVAWKEVMPQQVSIQGFKRKCQVLGAGTQKLAHWVALFVKGMNYTQLDLRSVFSTWKDDWLVQKLRKEMQKRARQATANLMLHLFETSGDPMYLLQICFTVWRESRLYARLRRVVKGMKARCRYVAYQTGLWLQRAGEVDNMQVIVLAWRMTLKVSRADYEIGIMKNQIELKNSKVVHAARSAALWLICYQDETLASGMVRIWKDFCYEARQMRREELLKKQTGANQKDKLVKLGARMVTALDGCDLAVVARIIFDTWKEMYKENWWKKQYRFVKDRSHALKYQAALGLRLWCNSYTWSAPDVVWLCEVTWAWYAAVGCEKAVCAQEMTFWNRAKQLKMCSIAILDRNNGRARVAQVFQVWKQRMCDLESAHETSAALAWARAAGWAGGLRLASIRSTVALQMALWGWYFTLGQDVMTARLATTHHLREKAVRAADRVCLQVALCAWVTAVTRSCGSSSYQTSPPQPKMMLPIQRVEERLPAPTSSDRFFTPSVHAWVRLRLRRQLQSAFFDWREATEMALHDAISHFASRLNAWGQSRYESKSPSSTRRRENSPSSTRHRTYSSDEVHHDSWEAFQASSKRGRPSEAPSKQGRPRPLTLFGLTETAAGVATPTLKKSTAQASFHVGDSHPSRPRSPGTTPRKVHHGAISATLPRSPQRHHGQISETSRRCLLARRHRREMALIFFAWSRYVDQMRQSNEVFMVPTPPTEPVPWRPAGKHRLRSNPTTPVNNGRPWSAAPKC